MGTAPILAQASFQPKERLGPPFTLIVPFFASSWSGVVFRAGATFANKPSRASTAARRDDELTPPGVVEPPEAPDGGYCVSPIYSLMASMGIPRVSATTMAM